MRILVDAMGGDNAPDQIALGAIQAAKDFGCEAVLVGRGEAILQALKDQGIETLPKGVEIANADDVVDMHDDPATVVKKKKDSSMVVGLTMLKEGGGDAFVSAGSTGALLSAATLIVRRVKGIRRAAMGPQIPTRTGRECVLIDCGATADCTPEFLLQFAFMGSYYAEKVLGIENPRVALLNIGAEDSKGGELQKAVYPLLKQAGEAGKINFTGNIEARDVPLGGADVVVSDGFSGNILLKGIEGTALFMASMMKDMFKKNLLTKLAALLCMDGVKAFKKKMDYRETGGTALIGLNKPVIKAHGSSDALAIRNAIRQAIGAVEADVAGTLAANIDHMVVPRSINMLSELEAGLGYTFRDKSILENALTHSSYANENRERGLHDNERLEFLGDSILGFVVADYLYRSFPDKPEGELTRIRADLVCEKNLARAAATIRLGSFLLLGHGEEHGGGRKRDSIVSDAMESVIAASYMDGGFSAAKEIIDRLILCDVPAGKPHNFDYKTALQELVQRKKDQVLRYELIGESGPDHDKKFDVEVLLNGKPCGKGTGSSKKRAEQAAAAAAIDALFPGEL